MPNTIFFIGAGASVPFGIPTMTEMVANFEEKTKEPHFGPGYVVQAIKNNLRDYKSFDIEALITVLQDITNYETVSEAIFNHPSLHFYTYNGYKNFAASVQTLGRQHRNEAKQILVDVKDFIVESCSIKNKPYEIYKELFGSGLLRYDFDYIKAINSGQADIDNCIFTTNYDLVLEAYCSNFDIDCEKGETRRLLSIDSSNQNLYGHSFNAHRIYKLHGSINWYTDEHGVMRWISEPVRAGKTTSLGHKVEKEFLLYPAFTKYTFREPFYTMFHYLKKCLVECKVCCVVGYSFRDEDILSLFHDALMINTHLNIVIIDPYAEKIKEEKFHNYTDKVHTIPGMFSVDTAGQLKSIEYKD